MEAAWWWTVTREGIVTPRPARPLRDGIELRPAPLADSPVPGVETVLWRTVGEPITMRKLLGLDGGVVARLAGTFGVDPPLLAAIAATESAGNPRARRQEPDGRASYGLFQTLNTTASGIMGTGLAGTELYSVRFATIVAITYVLSHAPRTGLDPIRVAADYNAGSARPSTRNPWGFVVHGDHLDRFAAWYGDACALCR